MAKPAVVQGSLVFLSTLIMVTAFQNCGRPLQVNSTAQNEVSDDQVLVDDMLLDSRAIVAKGSDSDVSQAAGGYSIYNAKKWPNGVVPVAFDSTISSTNRTNFFNACSVWSSYAGVKCISRTSEADYLYVTDDSSGCYTNVGAYGGPTPSTYQKRVFNFSQSWCWSSASLLHEIGHVLGLMHEHQRPDRDSYVQIITSNIQSAFVYAFDKFASMNEYGPYDYLSIMQYHSWSYSIDPSTRNAPTILKIDGSFIEGTSILSSQDKSVIAKMYPATLATPTPTVSPSPTPSPSPSSTPTPTPTPKRLRQRR